MQDGDAQRSNRAEDVPRCLQDVFVDRLTDSDRFLEFVQVSVNPADIMREFKDGIPRDSDASGELLRTWFDVYVPMKKFRGKEGVAQVELPEFLAFNSQGELYPVLTTSHFSIKTNSPRQLFFYHVLATTYFIVSVQIRLRTDYRDSLHLQHEEKLREIENTASQLESLHKELVELLKTFDPKSGQPIPEAVDVAMLAWKTALGVQQLFLRDQSGIVKAGAKKLRDLNSAHLARRIDVDPQTVKAEIESIRQGSRMSLTAARKLAAKNLGISYDTVLERLGLRKRNRRS